MKHALNDQPILYPMAGERLWRSMLELSIYFYETLLRAPGILEGQNKVLELANIIINYCIVINAYNNYSAQ